MAHFKCRSGCDEVPQWDFAEFTLQKDVPTRGNPFRDCSLVARVTEPDGTQYKITGFCDDEQGLVFRLRLMARKVGTTTLEIAFREGEEEFHHQTSFVTTESDSPGMVVAENWHFVWSGTGLPFWWNSTTAYFLLGLEENVMERAVHRLADQGINRIRVALCPSRQKDGNRWLEPSVQEREDFTFLYGPWPSLNPDSWDDPQYDVTRFDLAHWRKFERMLRLAESKNMVVAVIFFVDGQEAQNYPFNRDKVGDDPDEIAYYETAIARLSAFRNVEWAITNEWALFRPDEWVETRGEHLSQIDPYGHLLSVHGHGHFPFRASRWCTHCLFQVWDEHGGYDWGIRMRKEQDAAGVAKPQINEEFGYEAHYPYPWGEGRKAPARSTETRVRMAWELAFAGCFATTGEESSSGHGGWINGLAEGDSDLWMGHKRLKDFMTAWNWHSAVPRADLVAGYGRCLAVDGDSYAIYLYGGGTVALTLPHAENWQVDQFDLATGEWTPLSSGEPLEKDPGSPGIVFPFLPFGSQMAFLVRRVLI
ncbi:MAG: DUF5060 domain-containing protein [Fimbriimonadaceae bacterium]|jgi:hypothetical protein|nr:DUF5060 domain-containing protein [Fimbriimonadaceae bacterium]